MATNDDLDGIQGLHQDLLALSENRLKSVERLVVELEARVDEFRNFLNKKAKNDASRLKLSQGERLQANSPKQQQLTLMPRHNRD
jgi:nuclear pore complex protein Nup205